MIELEILYQDSHLIAVDKPLGMLVHRLDRPTSGVLLFALSSEIAAKMMPKFADNQIQKTYHAVIRGHVKKRRCIELSA